MELDFQKSQIQNFEWINKIQSIIIGNDDISTILAWVLSFLLNKLNQNSGLFFIKSFDSNDPYMIITQALTNNWSRSLNSKKGFLKEYALKLCATTEPLPAVPTKQIAFSYPIKSSHGCEGAFIVQGNSVKSSNIGQIEKYLNAFGEALSHIRIYGRNNGKHTASLQYVSAILNQDLELNEILLWILNGIKKTTSANCMRFFNYEHVHKNIITVKTLETDPLGFQQETIKIDDGFVLWSLKNNQIISSQDQIPDITIDTKYDGISGLPNLKFICVPMNTNSHTIGAIEVFFEKDHVIDPEEQGLVYYMATALANAITNTSLIKELKIANADLEASQWELLGSRNILRALFDNMPLSIYIIDPKYNLIAVNQSRANRLSQSPKNLVGKKCYQVLYNRKSPCPGCSVQSTFNYGKVTTRKTQEWNETNIPTEWEISTYPITGDNNLISKTIILEKDITEERELEESLIQSEKLAAVGQLAAGVAHEINNPLSAVIANAQLLLLDLPEDDDLLESVKLIELAGKRASQVVRNLLGFARKEQMDFDAVDINETIQSALSLLRHELMLHKVQLNIDLDDNMPPAIISSDHLHSVWINLIINAIDAIETTNAEISITSQYINQEFVITVADNGKGMDAEQKKHVFEPFYTTKRPGKGTGLGLSVCHRIIKQHGGNINIESKIDTGTKMIVKIPAHFSEIGKNNL